MKTLEPVNNKILKGKNTNLDKAERKKGYIVCTEQRVEQHFLDSAVKVALQLLHFCSNQLWCVRVCVRWTGVNRHVRGAGKLLSEVLS